MKNKIIAILLLLFGAGGGGVAIDRLAGSPSGDANVFSTTTPVGLYGSDIYAQSPINSTWATTTVSASKRSIYRPTSTDDQILSGFWVIATSTDGTGTPTRILPNPKGNRRFASICVNGGQQTINLFLTNVTTTDISVGRGIEIAVGECYEINSLNLWQGEVYAMASSSTSTISVIESK